MNAAHSGRYMPPGVGWLLPLMERVGVTHEVIRPGDRMGAGRMDLRHARLQAEITRTVIIHAGFGNSMLVVPQNDILNLRSIADTLGVRDVARVQYVPMLDCGMQVIPPLGGHYGMQLFLSDTVMQRTHICFYAGSYDALVRIPIADYLRLAAPRVIHLLAAEMNRVPLMNGSSPGAFRAGAGPSRISAAMHADTGKVGRRKQSDVRLVRSTPAH